MILLLNIITICSAFFLIIKLKHVKILLQGMMGHLCIVYEASAWKWYMLHAELSLMIYNIYVVCTISYLWVKIRF